MLFDRAIQSHSFVWTITLETPCGWAEIAQNSPTWSLEFRNQILLSDEFLPNFSCMTECKNNGCPIISPRISYVSIIQKKVWKPFPSLSSRQKLHFVYNEGMTLKKTLSNWLSIGISKLIYNCWWLRLFGKIAPLGRWGRTEFGFEHKNIEERIHPKLSLSAKTIISIAVAYPHKLKQPQKQPIKRGKLRSTVGD